MRIMIDLNSRAEDGTTIVNLGRLGRGTKLVPGAPVTVYEPDDEVRANAVIARIDAEHGLAYLDVDWTSLQDDFPSPPRPKASHAWVINWAAPTREVLVDPLRGHLPYRTGNPGRLPESKFHRPKNGNAGSSRRLIVI